MRLRKLSLGFLLFQVFLGYSFSPALAEKTLQKKSATEEDLFLYRAIGATYICVAREVDIEFSKASAIAAITYVNLLEGKHGGKIKVIGDKELSRKELIVGANNQLIPAAVEYCPDKIPNKTKKDVEKYLKELKKKTKRK
ncbi:hypothetical protein [Prochlorococcus marinus]|uniref:hypothetical protein n=1 Tax=Prochlorococcus marinus TaxID=1219 RepID=UPI0022B474EE|nr:hypothetical protein [Prochlorococcus marinus]